MNSETELSKQNSPLDEVEKSMTLESPKISACGCDTDHNNGKYVSSTYKNKRIYFCAESCKEEFLENPEAFLASDHFTVELDTLEDI